MTPNRKGFILLTVLWVVLVLSLIAWGLSRRSSMEVSLLQTYQGQVRSYAAARGGLAKVLNLLEKSSTTKDTLYNTGIVVSKTQRPRDIFDRIEIGDKAYAIVQWPAKGYFKDNALRFAYGIEDEQGKLDINGLTLQNYFMFSALLEVKGIPTSQAEALALAVVSYTQPIAADDVRWKGQDVALRPKGAPYDSIYEILEINGMTKAIFDKVKDDITVYSDFASNGVWVNVNTASNDLIEALLNYSVTKYNAQLNRASMAREAYAMRNGKDGEPFTDDDGGTGNNLPPFLHEGKSSNYKVRVTGVDVATGARSVINVYVNLPSGGKPMIKGWYRE